MLSASLHRRVISGEAGLWAGPIRLCLRAASTAYALAVRIRNQKFDGGRGVTRVSEPVISVGNITAGGTGKTPMVIDLLRRLERLKTRSVVVARGYKSHETRSGDEELLIRRRVPGVRYIANPNRIAGAIEAIVGGAGVIVLDDGFQHRALARDLEIVLIDATCPFGFDFLLPRGLLREPVRGLARADLIVVTRCDCASEETVATIHARLAKLAAGCPVLSCSHKPVSIASVDGTELSDNPDEFLSGKNVVAFSGLAHPQAFEQTVSSLGAKVIATRRWPDHHPYSAGEIRSMLGDPSARDIDLFVTSEKDAVKLTRLTGIAADRIAVVTVSIDFAGEDGTILDALLDRTLCQSRQQ